MTVETQKIVLDGVEAACQKEGTYALMASRVAEFMNGTKGKDGPFYQIIVGDEFSVALRHLKTDYMILKGSRRLKIFIFRAAPTDFEALENDEETETGEATQAKPTSNIRFSRSDMSSSDKKVVESILAIEPVKKSDRATALAIHLKKYLSRRLPSENGSWQVVTGSKGEKFEIEAVYEAGYYAEFKVGQVRCAIFRAKFVHPFPLRLPSAIGMLKLAMFAVPAATFGAYLWKSQTCETSCLSEFATCTDVLKQEQEDCEADKMNMAYYAMYTMFMAFAARFAMRRLKI
eukprot:g3124.t1